MAPNRTASASGHCIPGDAMKASVHLDVRSYFSLKDGAFSPEHLAVRAAELGMPAVAMTDRDGLYGAARFVAACDRTGVRPLLGATLTLRSGSVVVLAQDATGYANLCRLITDSHMVGERGDPSLAVEQLVAHASGLFCLLGPQSHVAALSRDDAVREVRRFREAFGDRVFVSVQHRVERDSNEEIRRMLRLAGDAGVRAVATNPVRYLVKEDAFLADALECMREIVPINRWNISRT